MKTFEQQLREYVEKRAEEAFPLDVEKQCILQNGAELIIPMFVTLFDAFLVIAALLFIVGISYAIAS